MKININGISYEVKMVDEPDESNSDVVGQFHIQNQTIKIKKGMGKEFTEYTIIHEIMHGIYDSLSFEQDEETIDPIARSLYSVIKSNPQFFKSILK